MDKSEQGHVKHFTMIAAGRRAKGGGVGELIGMKRTSPSPVAQMTCRSVGRGWGYLGVDLGVIKKPLESILEMAYDTVSKPHSQTIGKAVNRSAQLSKQSRMKPRKAKLNRLNRSCG